MKKGILLLLTLLLLAGITLLRLRQTMPREPNTLAMSETAAPAGTGSSAPAERPTETSAPSTNISAEAPAEAPLPTKLPTGTAENPDASAPPEPTATTVHEYTPETYQLVTDIVFTLHSQGEESDIQTLLETLRTKDPALGSLWQDITDYWFYISRDFEVHPGILPDGLPEDDSLGIVVLGFQLMYDGTMAPELIGRCETALACIRKYPNAAVIVTGGGTAYGNRSATEAGVMAAWFEGQGVPREKIILEERSLTTDQNATYTCEILALQHPEIRSLAIVSSDYHVALGSMLFTEAALLRSFRNGGGPPYAVVSNAAYATSGNPDYSNPRKFTADMWVMADPTY